MIQIYTDGSCIKNPNGPGGWGVILIEEDGYEYYFADGNIHAASLILYVVFSGRSGTMDICRTSSIFSAVFLLGTF